MSSWRDEVIGREADLIDLRRDLHRHPELAFEERRTAEIVAERLQRAGLEVTTGIAGTGVAAVLRGDRPGRTVAWRADMDALPLDEEVDVPFRSVRPGAMHACGHDGHTAIAVVVAEILAARRAQLSGSAVFLFQPGEEVLTGAARMIATGVLDATGCQEVYGLHLTTRLPIGQIEMRAGVANASADIFQIEVTGRGGHGATPHLAIDPIQVAAQIVVGLPHLVPAAVPAHQAAILTVGQLIAGTAPNIIPDRASISGSLRTLRPEDRRALLDRLATWAAGVAAGSRAAADTRHLVSCPQVVNHDGETARAQAACCEELGDAALTTGSPILASDDMSLFLEVRPGCYFRVGASPRGEEPGPAHHSPTFDMGEGSLAVGARAALAILARALT
jgi:amidohydrolase